MREADIGSVLAVQEQAYGAAHLLEGRDFFLNRLTISPATCWVARTDNCVLGYLISYLWDDTSLPKLNEVLHTLPKNLNTWFLHDCAVADTGRSRGVATALIKTGQEHARRNGFARNALVALAEAKAYWPRFGYKEVAVSNPAWKEQLQSYGDGASYMVAA